MSDSPDNSQLINQILNDLKNDPVPTNVNLPANQPPAKQIQAPTPEMNPVPPTNPTPPQSKQIKPDILPNSNGILGYNEYMPYIKDIVLFIIVYAILSMPDINSMILNLLPDDINLYIILLLKGIIGGSMFVFINYFITEQLS